MPNNQALLDFDSTAREMLTLLSRRLAFDLWMITRVEGNGWLILYANDNSYGVREGDLLVWQDSFCYRMATQNAPRVVPDCRLEPAYADTPIGHQLNIGAYIGIPLRQSDGNLFGTLCAINPKALPATIVEEMPLLELLSKMLEMILGVCLDMANQARGLDYASAESLKDELTGLYNCRGWEHLLKGEEERCRLYGHSACVISINLDDLDQVYCDRGPAGGEQYVMKLAEIIQSTARKQDVVARLDRSKFAILAVESGIAEGKIVLERLKLYLRLADLSASTAVAARFPSQNQLSEVWQRADAAAIAAL
ncbi:MAG: diguanylate cyclase [Elainellaceae cyanobacterium]